MTGKLKVVLRGLVLIGIGGLAWYLNRTGLLEKTLTWIGSFGGLGAVVFVVVYAMTCVFFIPSIVFTFSSGVLFGFWKGVLLSLCGVGLGSLGAFLIGRYLLRGVVEKRLGTRPEFVKLERAARKDGWKIVALARLSPVFPFLVGNYAFGITSIPALHYCGASVLGTVPSASVYTYLGTLFESLSDLGSSVHQRSWQEWFFLIAGLLATVWLSYYLKRFAQNVLSEKIK